MPRESHKAQKDEHESLCANLARPHGAPRGLLIHYVLHRIALKPAHGYEILQDIESKTEGAWRPGAGSIYPILKKLEASGLIEAGKASEGGKSQRVYSMTQKGAEYLKEAKETGRNAGQRWSSMRRIFIEMMDAEDVGAFFINGSKLQFDLAQELLRSKMDRLSPRETEYIMKDYALILERQLNWADEVLKGMQKEKEKEKK
jgi:DNA-binding PadR family transcriptional regulator